jgi:hypothetical protein
VIVTRQRKKPFPWRRLILPVVAIGLVIFAFVWPPSRNVITAGPMGPVWSTVGSGYGKISAPFTYAAQNMALTDKNKQILALQTKAADLQTQLDAKTKTIADLNSTVQQLQTAAANAKSGATPGPATNGAAGAAGNNPTGGGITGANGSTANDLSQGATPDMRRTASVWANMEPENASKVIQKLPIPYVAHILALMAPDTVGAILDALPADYAAKLTQDHPELKK